VSSSLPTTPVVPAPEALEFLTRAGMVIAGSLDYEQTLAHVVDQIGRASCRERV